jgi:choline dehydrogenase-like flavoprotein
MPKPKVNVVVVGSGAGGGVAACVLAEAGLSVILLEKGRWQPPFEERKDDLINQRSSLLGAGYGPDEQKNPRVAVGLDGKARIVTPRSGAYQNNASCVGGGTVSYGGQAWRFMPQDFRMRSIYGAVAGSTMEDWPISYDDLEPYYERAEYEIGVSGDVEPDPFKGPRRTPLPMPPMQPKSREYELLVPAAKRLGLHPFDTPLLINSVPYQGRSACMRIRWCVGFGCETNAKNGTHNTVIPRALATGHAMLHPECKVKEILVDDRGRATGVAYFDEKDRLQEQPADVVVVAGGATESARLLLLSKSRLFPKGIGNAHDWVGRNLTGHTYTGAVGFFEQVTYDDLGPGVCVSVCDYNHGTPGLVGGGMLANDFIRTPIQLTGQAPPGVASWGKAHKDFMRKYYTRNILVFGPTHDLPTWDGRVELDPVVKDYWGVPVLRISGDSHPETRRTADVQADRAAAWLEEAGAVITVPRKAGRGVTGGQHQSGTCRMGHDPKTSVVDASCRVHDVPNVFVMDASVHVTNGGFNPVLTIFANAFRAAELLARAWKGGGLKG